MSPKLPVLSGDDLIKALRKFGYEVVRQDGSHVRLRHSSDPLRQPLTVPRHKTLKPGLAPSDPSRCTNRSERITRRTLISKRLRRKQFAALKEPRISTLF